MKEAYKGREEFPKDNILKMIPEERKQFESLANFYKKMFLDAYVCTIQCETMTKNAQLVD